MKSITALAAVVAMGFPPKVEMVAPFTESAISGRAIVTPIGVPLRQALGAGDNVRLHAPLLDAEPLPPVRPQPVCTSSLMKTPPCFFTVSATIGKYSLGGVINPPTPCIGSAMNPAIRPDVVVRITSPTSCAHRTSHDGYERPYGQR